MEPSFPPLITDVLSKIIPETNQHIAFAAVSKEGWSEAAERVFAKVYAEYSKSQNSALKKWFAQVKQDPTSTLKVKHLYQSIFQEAKASEEGQKLLQSFSSHGLLSCEQLEQLTEQIEATWAHNLCLIFAKFNLPKAVSFFKTLQGSEKEKAYKIKEWMKSHPADLAKITKCNFNSLGLTYLPKEIAELPNLEELSLSSNHLRVIPKEIGKLTKLKVLYLAHNAITGIPKEIGKLNNLQVLSLSDNQLQEIPKEMSKLENLSRLVLSNNELQSIPQKISRLKNLHTLSLSNNPISKMPERISKFKKEGLNLIV